MLTYIHMHVFVLCRSFVFMYSYFFWSILSTVLMRFDVMRCDVMQYTYHNVSSNKYATFLC